MMQTLPMLKIPFPQISPPVPLTLLSIHDRMFPPAQCSLPPSPFIGTLPWGFTSFLCSPLLHVADSLAPSLVSVVICYPPSSFLPCLTRWPSKTSPLCRGFLSCCGRTIGEILDIPDRSFLIVSLWTPKMVFCRFKSKVIYTPPTVCVVDYLSIDVPTCTIFFPFLIVTKFQEIAKTPVGSKTSNCCLWISFCWFLIHLGLKWDFGLCWGSLKKNNYPHLKIWEIIHIRFTLLKCTIW